MTAPTSRYVISPTAAGTFTLGLHYGGSEIFAIEGLPSAKIASRLAGTLLVQLTGMMLDAAAQQSGGLKAEDILSRLVMPPGKAPS